ncbi:MAG: metallophosphoesterase [Nanoarchaeota archaeon]|nr:metallophosphoesterase [Nanoarchaeota archaeon]
MKLSGSRFAFISDLHGKNPIHFLKKLKSHPVDLVVLGGDIPDCTQRNLESICKKFLTLNIPIIIYPGSHENSDTYKKALSNVKNRLLIDALKIKNRHIQFGEMDLIIIPGSDTVASGTKAFNGGNHWLFEKREPSRLKKANQRIKEIKFAKKVNPVYVEDTKKLMSTRRSKPSSRILLTHIPFSCKTTKGLDVAHFGVAKKDFRIEKKDLKEVHEEHQSVNKGAVFTLKSATKLKKKGYPIILRKRNVGSEYISKFLKQYKITKFICGHIHEAGKRAISKSEKPIKQKVFYKESYINSGQGLTRITCKNEKISYEFL